MRTWNFSVVLDARSKTPLFLQIARAVAADVTRGRLRPGDALPGSRTLADALAVHRSKVVAAYAELRAQGWARTRPGGATSIAPTSPDAAGKRFSTRARRGVPARPGFDVDAVPADRVKPILPRARGALLMWG